MGVFVFVWKLRCTSEFLTYVDMMVGLQGEGVRFLISLLKAGGNTLTSQIVLC